MGYSKMISRALIALVDVEGSLSRSTKITGLHDFTFFFAGSVKINRKNLHLSEFKIQEPFSSYSFGGVPNEQISKVRKRFLPKLDYYMDTFNCESVLLCSWGSYDKHMLNPVFGDLLDAYHINLLSTARLMFDETYDFKSFKLRDLMKRYNFKQKQKHYSFTDTLFTAQILKCLLQEKQHRQRKSKLTTKNLGIYLQRYLQQTDLINVEPLNERRNSTQLSPSSSSCYLSSLSSPELEKYDILEVGDTIFKVRKGWKRARRKGFKNYGLYRLEKTGFKLIKNMDEKKEFLKGLLNKPSTWKEMNLQTAK